MSTRLLHVANGRSTTMTIEAAGLPGTCAIWADPLHDGPVPGNLTDDELVDVRMRFLTGGATGASEAAPDAEHSTDDLRQWRAAIARHESYDELILWYEHDLFDQLNLIQLLTWTREHVPSGTAVSLICIGSFPGRPGFKGLGELSVAELAPLLDTRRPVTGAQYALAERAWQAFRNATPEPLDALRHENTGALPYLAAALTRFLQEYPWTRDGLSRSERRLLELAADDISLRNAFPRMHDGEDAYYVSDGTLMSMVEDLAASSPPLLALDSSRAEGPAWSDTVSATTTGQQVLDGTLDRVAVCGIDRWLGGVHLQGRTVPWRWDAGQRRIVRT